jgi:hypothetical protein
MRDISYWSGEDWYGYPSEAWPDEGLERGLPRPSVKIGKNLEVSKFDTLIDFELFYQYNALT